MSYLTPDEVANQLGVTGKTIREWLKSKELVGVKLGGSWKIHESDLSRFVDGQRLEALIKKAESTHPDENWQGDQCNACGELIAVPYTNSKTNWVCSVPCKKTHDTQWANIVGRNSDEFAFNQGRVIPHF